jgi:hypothetical protein
MYFRALLYAIVTCSLSGCLSTFKANDSKTLINPEDNYNITQKLTAYNTPINLKKIIIEAKDSEIKFLGITLRPIAKRLLTQSCLVAYSKRIKKNKKPSSTDEWTSLNKKLFIESQKVGTLLYQDLLKNNTIDTTSANLIIKGKVIEVENYLLKIQPPSKFITMVRTKIQWRLEKTNGTILENQETYLFSDPHQTQLEHYYYHWVEKYFQKYYIHRTHNAIANSLIQFLNTPSVKTAISQ